MPSHEISTDFKTAMKMQTCTFVAFLLFGNVLCTPLGRVYQPLMLSYDRTSIQQHEADEQRAPDARNNINVPRPQYANPYFVANAQGTQYHCYNYIHSRVNLHAGYNECCIIMHVCLN